MRKQKLARYGGLGLLAWIGAILICLGTATSSQAHWADMAAAEIVVGEQETQMTLTFPTGLVAFADTDQDGQLAVTEVQQHSEPLRAFLAEQIQFTTVSQQVGSLRIEPVDRGAVSLTGQAAPNTHSTLKLVYSWLQPVQGLTINYKLFLPDVPTASCLATILQADRLKTHVFTPQNPTLALTSGLPGFMAGGWWLALLGALGWGAVHSLSPGHGKTIVAAYLIGGKATAKHAVFLAATTTMTHTIGVFALGFATLFAAKYLVPEQLYRWLGLVSGLMIVVIGVQLLRSRLNSSSHHHSHHLDHTHNQSLARHHHDTDHHGDKHQTEAHLAKHSIDLDTVNRPQINHPSSHSSVLTSSAHCPVSHHEHSSHRHHHTHHYVKHHEHHEHNHGVHHHHHHHHHLPPGADDTPVTWRSLLMLGISGGLIPCPAALVLLLSCIALGNVGLGLVLVLAFSLGLAAVLTGLGLALIYAKQMFQFLPASILPVRVLPVLSALGIVVIGCGISLRALIQVMSST